MSSRFTRPLLTAAEILLAFAPCAFSQQPARPLQPPVRPPLRRATAPSDQNQLDGNEALFTVLAAINMAGYDDQIDAASTHPFRHQLRTELGTRSLDSIFELKRFFRDHKIADPKECQGTSEEFIEGCLAFAGIEGPLGERDFDVSFPHMSGIN